MKRRPKKEVLFPEDINNKSNLWERALVTVVFAFWLRFYCPSRNYKNNPACLNFPYVFSYPDLISLSKLRFASVFPLLRFL